MTDDDLAAILDRLACRYVFRDEDTGEIWIDGGALQRVDIEALLAEVHRLQEERRGMVAESSWDELADEVTEVEADNARLRAAIREHDRRYTRDGGGRARCYPVMGELLPGDDDD